jgi:prolyl 4-hydroxylase
MSIIENKYNNSELKIIDSEWRKWIQHNIAINDTFENKEQILNILLNHFYLYENIIEEMNFTPTNPFIIERQTRQKNMNKNEFYKLTYYKQLQDNPSVYLVENNFLEIYQIYNFLNDNECDNLISEIKTRNSVPSGLTDNNENNNFRTSKTYHLNNNKILHQINQKIHEIMKIPVEKGELLQIQHYSIGNEFKEHTDCFNEPRDKIHLQNGGQRTYTFMMYLNEVENGGTTFFPKINKDFKPKKGMALIWNNLQDNKENIYSLHCGKPVITGEKFIITKWFRQNNYNN